MSDDRPELLNLLLATLLQEEALLARLTELSQAQRQALINSEFAGIDAINEQMLSAADELLPFEGARAEIIARLGVSSLADATALADSLAVPGFSPALDRLRLAAARFRSGQEQNAALVLNAMRLRERWMNFLGGRMSPTYGSGGMREVSQQRQFVSKSA